MFIRQLDWTDLLKPKALKPLKTYRERRGEWINYIKESENWKKKIKKYAANYRSVS